MARFFKPRFAQDRGISFLSVLGVLTLVTGTVFLLGVVAWNANSTKSTKSSVTTSSGDTISAADTATLGINATQDPIFTVQNAGGSAVFTVDTPNNQVILGQPNALTGQLVFGGGGSSYTISLIGQTNATADRIITLPNESGTICTTGSICAGYAPASSIGSYVQIQGVNPTIQQVGGINVSGAIVAGSLNAAGSVTASSFSGEGSAITGLNADNIATGTLGDARLTTNIVLLNRTTQIFSGNNTFSGTIGIGGALTSSGLANFNNLVTVKSDGLAAFQVQDSANAAVFTVDTTHSRIGIGVATPAYTVDANGSINATGSYLVNGTQLSSSNLSNDANLAKLDGTGPQTFTGDNKFTGNFTYRAATNSLNGFQVQNAAGNNNLIIGDTINTRVGIGVAAPNYTLDVNGDANLTNGHVYKIHGVTVCTDIGCTPSSGSNSYVQIQASTPGVAQSGSLNITGTAIAGAFSGSGLGLTNLDASQVATGTLDDLRLSSNVTKQGNSFNGASQLVQTTALSYLPALNGSLLTNLNGSNIASGTVNDSRLSANVALLGATSQTFSGSNTFSSAVIAPGMQTSSNGHTVGLGFSGTATGNLTYNFDNSAAPGTYNICTSVGNCSGVAGGVTTTGGTTNKVPKFNGVQTLTDSIISDNGSTVSVGGTLNATIITQNNNTVCDVTGNCAGIGGTVGTYGTPAAGTIAMFHGTGTIENSILTQASTTVTAAGNINVSGQYQVGGIQISSAALSNNSNLAKLDGSGPQTFTDNNSFTGTVLLQNASNSASAFQVKTSGIGGTNVLIADTLNSRVGIGAVTPAYTLDVAGDINISTGSSYRINGTAICGPSTTCAPSSGSGSYIQNGVSTQTSANFNIQSTATGSVVGVLQGKSGQTADLLQVKDGSGNTVTSVSSTGAYVIRDFTGGSATYFAIKDQNNTSLFNVSTLAGQISMPNALNASTALTFGGDTTANIYRSASATLTTDGNLVAAGTLGVGVVPSSGRYLEVQGANSSGYISSMFNSSTAASSSGLSIRVEQNASTNILLNVQTGASGTAFQVTGDKKVKVGTSSTGVLQLLNDAGTNATGIQFGSTGDTNIYRRTTGELKTDSWLEVAGELYARYGASSQVQIGAQGPSSQAGITFASGATIYQTSANNLALKADNTFNFEGSTSAITPIQAYITGDSVNRFTIATDGKLNWGPGNASRDTNLYRAANTTLQTDSAFRSASVITARYGSANSVQIGDVGPSNNPGFTFYSGGTTNLYSSGASVIRTDGALQSAGGISSLDGNGDLTVRSTSSAKVFVGNIGSGVAGLQLGSVSAANLYQSAAYTLKTDGNLNVGSADGNSIAVNYSGPTTTNCPSATTGIGCIFLGTGGSAITGDVSNTSIQSAGTLYFQNAAGSTTYGRINSTGLAVGSIAPTAALNLASDAGDAASGIKFGSTGDTTLYRNGASSLLTGSNFVVQGVNGVSTYSLASNEAFRNFLSNGDSNPAFRIIGNGKLQWGAGGGTSLDATTNLYRNSSNGRLKTDANFEVGQDLRATGDVFAGYGLANQIRLALSSPKIVVGSMSDGATSEAVLGNTIGTGGTPGVSFGVTGLSQDTTLYRSAANNLRTTGTIIAATALQAPAIDAESGVNLSIATTNATGIIFGSTTSTGTITIGQSTKSNTISLGNGDTETGLTQTISIGGSSHPVGTGKVSINIGSNNSASNLVNIESGTGASAIQIGNGATSHGIKIGTGAALQQIQIGTIFAGSTTAIYGGDGATAISINASTSGTIGIGNINNNPIEIGNITQTNSITLGQSTENQTINIGNANTSDTKTQTINIGAGTGVSTGKSVLTIGSIANASSTTVQAGTGNLTLTTNSVSASIIAKTQTNSASAFQVQNAAGSSALLVDTTSLNSIVSNGSFETNTTGWVANGTGASIAQSSTQKYVGSYSLAVTTGTAIGNSARLTVGTALSTSTTYTMSFYAMAGTGFSTLSASYSPDGTSANETDCAVFNPSRTVTTTGWTRYYCTIKTPSTATSASGFVSIKQSDATSRTLYIDGVQIEAGSAITQGLVGETGFESALTNWANLSSTSVAKSSADFYNGANDLLITGSTTANSGAKYTTANSNPRQLATGSTYTLSFWGKASGSNFSTQIAGYARDGSTQSDCTLNSGTVVTTGWTYYYCTIITDGTSPAASAYIYVGHSDTSAHTWMIDDVQLSLSSTVVTGSAYKEFGLALNGVVNSPTIFKNQNDSTTALQVQNSAGTTLFVVDTSTSGGIVTLGTASSTPVIFILGNKNTSGDPASCTGGSIYYNSNSAEFRGCNDAPVGSQTFVTLGNPAGTIVAFAGSSAPNGYLIADGTCVSRTTYANLFAIVGTTYSDNATSSCTGTQFNLPDLRGRAAVGLNASQTTRTDVTALGKNEGAVIGSRTPFHKVTVVQPTISQPSVNITDPGHAHSYTYETAGGGGFHYVQAGASSGSGTTGSDSIQSHTTGITAALSGAPVASGGTAGPQTNVPTDAGAFLTVNYIIKY